MAKKEREKKKKEKNPSNEISKYIYISIWSINIHAAFIQ